MTKDVALSDDWVGIPFLPDRPLAVAEDPQLYVTHRDVDMDVSSATPDGYVGRRCLEPVEGVGGGAFEGDDLLFRSVPFDNEVQYAPSDVGSEGEGRSVSVYTFSARLYCT